MLGEEIGERGGVGVRPRDTQLQRVHSALREPAVERAAVQSPGDDGVADGQHQAARTTYRTERHVAVAAEHLRNAVENDARLELQRTQCERRGEGVVHDEQYVM